MTARELDTDQLLGALGELHKRERAELLQLESSADELAAREPERAQALEDRLMDELFSSGAAMPLRAATPAQPRAAMSFKDVRMVVPSQARPRRFSKLASAAAVSVAMAAAVLLWARQPAEPFEVTYTLVAPAPDAQSRSAAAPTISGVYSLGRTLRFALRPAERYTGALTVTSYAVQDDTVLPLEAQVELDPAGGALATLDGEMLSRALREGSWELRFYIAPPSATAVSQSQVRAGQCPSATRCLSFAARFVRP
jgi:hypothetical protein